MSKNIEISVIVPVYNCEEHIRATLDSILSQGVSLEIIAVDDGSTDASARILFEYERRNPNFRVISFSKNRGVGAARDVAVKNARGKYIAFCDADDVLPSGAYRSFLSVAGEHDIVIGAYLNVNQDGLSSEVYKPNKSTLLGALFFVSCLWNKLFRREFIDRAGISFDSDMTIGEDVVFLSRIATLSPGFAVTDSLVYAHKLREGSLIHTYTAEAFKKHIECRRRMLEICPTREALDFVYNEFSGFLKDFLLRMERSDLYEAFFEYRKFMLEYDYLGNENLFVCIVGLPRDTFLSADAGEYIRLLANASPRDRVLAEYYSGGIGFRWILKFFLGWIKYKISKLRK